MQQNDCENGLFQPAVSSISFERVLDSVLDVVCVFDTEGQFVHVNQASLSLLGYHPHEIVGRSYKDFTVREDLEKTEHCTRRIMEGCHSTNFENRYYRKDGSIAYLAWSGKWDPRDQLVYCVARDASDKVEKEKFCKQYEREIERSNAEMNEMLERITDGFFAMDAEWRITYINLQAVKMVAVRREDYLYKNYWELFPELIGSVFYEQYHRAFREKVPVHFEAYVPPFEMWVEVNAYPSEKGLSVFFRDVTEKRKVEEELRNLSLIVKETQNQVFIMNADHTISWVNEAFTVFTGYSLDEAVGKRPSELLTGPETDPQLVHYIDEQLDKKQPFHYEILNYTKDHKKFWIQNTCQPIVNENGVLQKYFVIGTDITERKNTEQELRKLSLIARETNNFVTITDAEGKITWVNNAFIRKTGYSLDEVVGRRPEDLLWGPETGTDTDRLIMEQSQTGESIHAEVLNYTKAGEKFWVEFYAQPVNDEKGQVTQYFGIGTDITERKKLQAQLLQEQKSRQQMITAAAIKAQENERAQVGRELHDNVNQVLTAVKLYQDLCLKDVCNSEELIRKSLNLLQLSINEIRSLSKQLSAPSLGGIRLRDSVMELVETVSATNKISLMLDTTSIDKLNVDHELHLSVYRILQEHLTNILKHADAQNVHVCFDIENDDLKLRVLDDGKGFDTKKKSSGIGITNMTTRAESLNGSLTINSTPGLGCVLTARFPLL